MDLDERANQGKPIQDELKKRLLEVTGILVYQVLQPSLPLHRIGLSVRTPMSPNRTHSNECGGAGPDSEV